MQDALWDFEADGAGGPAGGPQRPDPRQRQGQRPAERRGGRPGPGEQPQERRARAGYGRRGLDQCPACGQPVEVFALALTEGAYDAVVPGEYPSGRVPEEAARHVVRGRLWPGRDPGGWSRIRHRSVCPEEAMPEDRELLAMWRALRVRRRARAEQAENE